MSGRVHILCTVRRFELLPYSVLVFQSLRVGFPNARVTVHCNGLDAESRNVVAGFCDETECEIVDLSPALHHFWIERLLSTQTEPFVLLDTDVRFFGSVESWRFDSSLAGYLVPEFKDEFSRCITRSRLHTSLLYIDPARLKADISAYESLSTTSQFTPKINLIHPVVLPFNGQSFFYDTCSLLFHAIGGTAFTGPQKDCYFHAHFGCFSDLVLPMMAEGQNMAKARAEILAHPELGIGIWRQQDEYFAARQFEENGKNVIAEISEKDGEEARRWNVELCQGNQAAMAFCDLWYRYCHGIDDLIDTLRDGRPRMSKEQMVSLFFNAALLYNSEFFIRNREILCPIVLQVTNTYQDSIAWEHASKPHLRAMADVFRTCGNEIFVMVALICGGEAHMRKMSMAIKERDWLGQHDDAGNPV